MDEILSYFSAHYSDARGRFLAAAQASGARVKTYQNPVTGPQGELLATDIARLGPADASRLLLLVSATHGNEGFCGSGIQVGLLGGADPMDLPRDTAVVLVHAINPYGFAWLRRVTEDNVDLNRNFVDHAAGAYPDNPGYDALADALAPPRWDEDTRAATAKTLDAYGAENGLFALQAAISRGQYRHPDGLFYGGAAPTWSARVFEEVVAGEIAGAAHAALIDLHTGLGPYGYGEPIAVDPPHSDGLARAKAWYGDDVTSPFEGDGANAASPEITGHLAQGCAAGAPQTSWTSMTLEFGTQPLAEVIDALRADTWLHAHGDLKSHQARDIKATMRATFYGDEPDWKTKIWERGRDMANRALAGLAAL